MSPRDLALRALVNLFAALACLLALVAIALRGLLAELSDDVKASRNEQRNRTPGGTVPKNKRVRDLPSTNLLRAMNAELAARHGDTARVQAELDVARFYAENAAMPIRRSL